MVLLSLCTKADILPPDLQKNPDRKAKYLFYIHGQDVDERRFSAEDSLDAVTQALRDIGYVVLTEVRAKTAVRNFPNDHERYAKHVAKSVYKLIHNGVPAANITVAGYARGGIIAMMSSSMINHSAVHYVLLAACPSVNGTQKEKAQLIKETLAPKLRGRMLSLIDVGDKDFGSCVDYFEQSKRPLETREYSVNTRQDHEAFLEPRREWLQLLENWSDL